MQYLKRNRDTNKNEKELSVNQNFAEGFCFYKIFYMFIIGCLIGTYYEEILTFIREGVWVSRQGVIYGPFNPVYGFAVAGFVALLGKNIKKRKWYLTYLYCCIIGGITEYCISLFCDVVFHTQAWDYSGYFLNINGRTTIPFALGWGIGGYILVVFIYPLIGKLVEKIPIRFGKIFTPIFIVFMCLNMVVSWSAQFRQAQRWEGKKPITFIGEIYDKVYTDSYLKKVFPNSQEDKKME